MFCRKCGKQMGDKARFCPCCGEKIANRNTTGTDPHLKKLWIGLGCGGVGIIVLVFLFAIGVLGHKWEPATCATPEICRECGKTRGETLPHTWIDATCTEPKTCSRCGATEGDVLDHDWQQATATEPMRCRSCGITKGYALGNIENVEEVLEAITGHTYK